MDYWGIGGACSLQVLPSFSVGFGGLEVAFLYSLSKLFTWILHCNLGTWWQSSCREFLKFSPWILHFFFWLFGGGSSVGFPWIIPLDFALEFLLCGGSFSVGFSPRFSYGFGIGLDVFWWWLSIYFSWNLHWIYFCYFISVWFSVLCCILQWILCVSLVAFFVGCFLIFSGLCNGIWGWWWLFLALSMPRQEQRGLDCDCLAVFSGLSHNETWALSKAQSSPGYMQPPSVFRWPLEFLPEL